MRWITWTGILFYRSS